MNRESGDAVAVICRLHAHRQWANRGLLEVAKGLSSEALHQRFPMGQRTVWLSLTHLFAAEYIWFEALQGDENPSAPGDAKGKLPGNQMGEDAFSSLSELKNYWQQLDQRWSLYLGNLTADSLGEMVYKVSSISGAGGATYRSDVLLHVCTHAQYTTAQVINMFRHLGVKELPDLMLISMARQRQR